MERCQRCALVALAASRVVSDIILLTGLATSHAQVRPRGSATVHFTNRDLRRPKAVDGTSRSAPETLMLLRGKQLVDVTVQRWLGVPRAAYLAAVDAARSARAKYDKVC